MPKNVNLTTKTSVSIASYGNFDSKEKKEELFHKNNNKDMLNSLPPSQSNVHNPFSPLNQFLLMQHYFKLLQPPFVYSNYLKTFSESQNYFQPRCLINKNSQLGLPSDVLVDKKSETCSENSTSNKHDSIKQSENRFTSNNTLKLEFDTSPSLKTTNTSLDWEDSDEVDVVDVDQVEVTSFLKTENSSDVHGCKNNRKRKFDEMNDKDKSESDKRKCNGLVFTEKTISDLKKNHSNTVKTSLNDKMPTKSLLSRQKRAEANARERNRVHTISAAFEALRRAVPCYPGQQQRLSKLAILKIASSYILALVKLSQIDYSFSDCEGDDDEKVIRDNEEANDSNHENIADSNRDAACKDLKKSPKTKENYIFNRYENTSYDLKGKTNVIGKNSNIKIKNKMSTELSKDKIKGKEGFHSNSSTLALYVDLCTKTIREESKIKKSTKE